MVPMRQRLIITSATAVFGVALVLLSRGEQPIAGAATQYRAFLPGLAADAASSADPGATTSSPTLTPTALATPTPTQSPMPDPTETPIPPGDDLTIRIQAFRVSDDNGQRQAHVTAEDVLNWVAFTNGIYAPAGISFSFNPSTDFIDVQSTLLNNMTGIEHPQWQQQRQLANSLQAQHPGSFAVFFRWGPDATPSGGGFSWYDYNFVVMGGWQDMGHCGHQHWEALGHELGHFLGLPHTFATEPFANVAAAESYFVAHGKNVTVFDGDGLSDTPPDPGTRSLECLHTDSVSLAGAVFNLPRTNIMSYYDEAHLLTPQQIERVRWVFEIRESAGGAFRKNSPALPKEAESFAGSSIAAVNSSYGIQDMAAFGPERFSGGNQVFWVPNSQSGKITFKFVITTAGTYQIGLFATLAPDFGMLSASIDGTPTGPAIDGYAPLVVPSGRIALGSSYLAPGVHELTFAANGKNPASAGSAFGFDAFEIISRAN
ncbi:MAG: M43 family zinc metalloprotease [Dehalococcoidia bacterium]